MRGLVAGALGWSITLQPAIAQSECVPDSPGEQLQQAVAVVDVTVQEIVPTEIRAEVHASIDRIIKDDTGSLTVGGALTLPTSRPGTGVAGEVPFNDGWPYWRLYLEPLEPGSADLTTKLCDGSSMIPAPT